MVFYDDIYETASDNYGLLTAAEARRMGISKKEISRLTRDGRLRRLGYGVYKIKHYTPTPLDPYAEAVALVGPDAYLFGESVLAMHGLVPTNPARIFVATPARVRRTLLPSHIVCTRQKPEGETAYHEGIPTQSIPHAILSSRKTIMTDRLRYAVQEARRQGLITEKEEGSLQKELSD